MPFGHKTTWQTISSGHWWQSSVFTFNYCPNSSIDLIWSLCICLALLIEFFDNLANPLSPWPPPPTRNSTLPVITFCICEPTSWNTDYRCHVCQDGILSFTIMHWMTFAINSNFLPICRILLLDKFFLINNKKNSSCLYKYLLIVALKRNGGLTMMVYIWFGIYYATYSTRENQAKCKWNWFEGKIVLY